jgi:molecular chaperone GrpE
LFAYARKPALSMETFQMGEEKEEQSKTNEEAEFMQKALETEKQRSEDCLTQLKYARADLENFKKRSDRQIDEVRKYGNERIVIGLLDVVDELELAIESARSSNSSQTLVQGIEMTLKKLKKILENEGVCAIDCVGKPFDPSKHHAIAKTEEEGVDGCKIVEEVRKGYTIREKVIRPSIVKVVVQPSKS